MNDGKRYPLPDAGRLDGWIAGIAAGDGGAMEQLYREAGPAVYGFALSILKNAHDAEDVMHDTFVNVHRAAAGYRPQGKPMAWILTIARNLAREKQRERQRQGDVPEDWAEKLADENLSHEDRLVIRSMLDVLSPGERQVLFLHAVAGLKHREIALLTKRPLSTVLSRYHRGIQKVKKQLEGEGK